MRKILTFPFWPRLVIFAFVAFLCGLTTRLVTALAFFLGLLGLFLVAWLIQGIFGSPAKSGPPATLRKVARGVGVLVGVPLMVFLLTTGGWALSDVIKPPDAAELALRDQWAADRQKAAEEEARQAQIEAEQAARDEAKSKAQAAAEAERVAAEEKAAQAQAAAEEKAAQEKAAAEEKAAQAQAAAEAENQAIIDAANQLQEMHENEPLLYIQKVCSNLKFPFSRYVQVDPSGNSLFLSTKSSDDNDGLTALSCVRFNLNWSQPFLGSLSSTSALSGTRTWSEKGFTYQWNYHPNSGLNMTIVRN